MGGEGEAVEAIAQKKVMVVERRLKTGEVILRFAMLVLAILSAVRVATDKQTRDILGLNKTAKFTDVKALLVLVVMNWIVASYSFVRGVICILSMYTGSSLLNKPLAWLFFGFDQTMAYLILGAAAAATESAYLAKRGQSEFQWIKVCDFYGKFCSQIGEGLVSAFFVSLCMITVSGMSAYNLFRLYGTKGKNIQ
uniref:CASP-like protein n=1 Tax=Wollemia nobilis TaxID=56998 RepID=A0A0C9SA06_9CONI